MASLLVRLRAGSVLSQSCLSQLQVTSKHSPSKVIPSYQKLDKYPGYTLPVNTLPESAGIITRLCHKLASNDHDKEIYSGILSTQIKLVKTFSLTTSCIGLACQSLLYSYSANTNLGVMLFSGAFLSFFTFVTPVLIHSISKKYVTKLYYNQVDDKYTAVVYNIFIRPKKIEFRLRDVKVPDIPGMFTTFKAKDHALFVDMEQFRDPTHFEKLMGYADSLRKTNTTNDGSNSKNSVDLSSQDLSIGNSTQKKDNEIKH
jgi:transmembrane protein 70